MMKAACTISTQNAVHYLWGENCEGWHLVRAAGLSVIQERMPAGTAEVRHWHRAARQFFYVLAGELTMKLDGVTMAVPAGHGCEVAPGIAHQVLNRSGGAVDFLVISEPPAQGDRVMSPAPDDPSSRQTGT